MMPDEPANAVAIVEGERQSNNFLAAILAAATDPNTDATKVETMANLAVKLQDRERETEFNRALVAAQLEMPVLTRDGIIKIPANREKNTPERIQGRFAKWEDIDRVVRPILARHHLALRFEVGNVEQSAVTVRPILTHANGYTERGEAMKLPADGSGSKNATQAVGSSVAYGKRYSACAMLNIVTEGVDDDGRGGTIVSLPYEREQLVLDAARAAHEAGHYLEWFGTATPKERAWLIANGHHVAFGGQTALPSAPPPPAAAAEPEAAPATNGQQTAAKPTAEQKARTWVDWFKGEVDACTRAAEITALQDESEDTLAQLQRRYPALHREATRAADDKLASL